MDAATTAKVDDILARLKSAGWKERDAVKEELLAFAAKAPPPDRPALKEHLENARKDLPLEIRWEIDEVVEALTPPPAPPPQKEEPKPEEPKRLSAADLNLVYDDPRGLMLYKTKKAPERWFATQVDPRTGQPQTFELHPTEIAQLKTQLAGSPYWVLGSGETGAR